MAEAVRQRYAMATGKGLQSAPKGPEPKFAKGGKIPPKAGKKK